MKLVTEARGHFESKEAESEWINRFDFIDFLKNYGMRKEHYVLDIGCGHLRHGIDLIKFLDSGHYYGYDIVEAHLQIGLAGVKKYGLEGKKFMIGVEKNFDVSSFNQKFDFIFASSVFTHIHKEDILKCVRETLKYMDEESKFFATFYREDDFSGCDDYGPGYYYLRSTQPASFYENDFKGICKVEVIGQWPGSPHTYGQQMILFQK